MITKREALQTLAKLRDEQIWRSERVGMPGCQVRRDAKELADALADIIVRIQELWLA